MSKLLDAAKEVFRLWAVDGVPLEDLNTEMCNLGEAIEEEEALSLSRYIRYSKGQGDKDAVVN